jgi:hypothetical protein
VDEAMIVCFALFHDIAPPNSHSEKQFSHPFGAVLNHNELPMP